MKELQCDLCGSKEVKKENLKLTWNLENTAKIWTVLCDKCKAWVKYQAEHPAEYLASIGVKSEVFHG